MQVLARKKSVLANGPAVFLAGVLIEFLLLGRELEMG